MNYFIAIYYNPPSEGEGGVGDGEGKTGSGFLLLHSKSIRLSCPLVLVI